MRGKMVEHRIKLNNTRTPLFTVLEQSGKPVDLTGKTAKFRMVDEDGNVIVDNGTTGITAHPTSTFTAIASSDWIVSNDHLVLEGDQIVLSNSGGALPAGLTANTRYFARDVMKNRFRLCEVEGESKVDITDAGTGTHAYYVVGGVQYDFQAGNVDVEGEYKAFVNLYDGSEFDSFPVGGHIRVVIEEEK